MIAKRDRFTIGPKPKPRLTARSGRFLPRATVWTWKRPRTFGEFALMPSDVDPGAGRQPGAVLARQPECEMLQEPSRCPVWRAAAENPMISQKGFDGSLTDEPGPPRDRICHMVTSGGFVRSVMEAWMADELQNYLTSEIETLRSAVFRAGALNAKALGPSAEAHLENVLRFVRASEELEEATFLTVTRIALFARALYAQARIGEIEQARRNALAAIDVLAILVEGSVPSQPAPMAGRLDMDISVPDRMAPIGD